MSDGSLHDEHGDVDLQTAQTPIHRAPIVIDDPPMSSVNRTLLWVIVGFAGVLSAWLTFRSVSGPWQPWGDRLTLEMRVSDVFTSHTPLVGVWSRYQWNHPGPLLFYALSVPYRLSESSGFGLLIGIFLINIGAIFSAIWVALRRSRQAAALAGLFLVLLCTGLRLEGLTDPWNPYVGIVPLFAASVACWRVLAGDRVAAIVVVVFGSFAMQAHAGLGVPVVTILAISIVALTWQSFRSHDKKHARRTSLYAALTLFALWVPPIIDQIVHDPGNIRLLFKFFTDGVGVPVGFSTGTRIMFRILSVPGNWVSGSEPEFPNLGVNTHGWAIPWALIGVVLAMWWSWRRKWRAEFSLSAVAVSLLVVSTFALSRIIANPMPYLVRWTWAIAAFTWFAIAVVIAKQFATSNVRKRLIETITLLATLSALLVLCVRGVDFARINALPTWQATIDAVEPPTLEALHRVPGPVYVSDGYGVDGIVGLDIIMEGRRQGLDIRRGADWGYIMGNQRVIDASKAERRLLLLTGWSRLFVANDSRFEEIVSYDPLTAAERSELELIENRNIGVIDSSNPSMSELELAQQRDHMLQQWRGSASASSQPSDDILRYKQLIDKGEILTVFLSNQPIVDEVH